MAAITIVSYSGISNRAKIASIQSDLANSAKQLKIFNIDNGYYPTTISTDCTANPTNVTNLCLKASNGNDYTSTPYSRPNEQSFILTATNGTLIYHINENSGPIATVPAAPNLATTDPTNWTQVGAQVWAKYNLNVGNMITANTDQTNNGGNNTIEKYCYGNLTAYCTANNNGGLYQWNEAMNYSTTPGAQGICPAGSHIPTDNDWKILEVQLGMTQVLADTSNAWRGTDQGTKLKPSGNTGLNIPLVGYRSTDTSFSSGSLASYLWSSSESGVDAWVRYLFDAQAGTYRTTISKSVGFSVRCIGN